MPNEKDIKVSQEYSENKINTCFEQAQHRLKEALDFLKLARKAIKNHEAGAAAKFVAWSGAEAQKAFGQLSEAAGWLVVEQVRERALKRRKK